MGSATIEPMMRPDSEQMMRHFEHLFGGDLDGCHEGKIELAWTDGDTGRLQHALVFGTDQLDKMVARAVEINSKPKQNVYVGQALRRPQTPPFGRGKDEDFFALTAFYVDLDDDVVATARESYRHRGCPPTAVVVTGRDPHVRAQMLWRQELPERDPETCRRQNKALSLALGGDTSVVNPARVMRLGGSVAWPVKPGRVLERTEFITFDDSRPKVYSPGQLVKAFPPQEDQPALPSGDSAQAASVDAMQPEATAQPTSPPRLQIGSEFDSVTVEACLAAVRAGDHWHNNMVRLTGHWIARGWSDEEILTAAAALTLSGYTVEQTRREVTAMLAGGRAKWNVPNPEHSVADEKAPTSPLEPAFIDSLDVAMLPRRRWVLGGALLRGHVTVMVAPPGVGKSTLGIEQAVAIATGRDITGQPVNEKAKVWIYNNEDDGDELRRRLAAVLQHWDIPFADIKGRIALNSGAERPLLFAQLDRSGNAVRLPDVDACIDQIRTHEIGVFIVDPFVETHEVSENSNEHIKAVAAMFREVARATGCAVLLVHHTAKPPQGTSDGHAGNMNTARGASALTGVARVVQTLFSMSPRDAERYGVDQDERHLYIRLDDAKANVSLVSGSAQWFRRHGVAIANGDEVGVLVPDELAPASEARSDDDDGEHRTIIGCLLAQVSEPEISLNAAARLLAWSGGERFARYRETDARGHQRTSRPFRETIAAACSANISIVEGGKSKGFTCDRQRKPITLRRFELPATADNLAAQTPEFTEEE